MKENRGSYKIIINICGAYGSKPKIFKYNQLLSHFHK